MYSVRRSLGCSGGVLGVVQQRALDVFALLFSL